MNTYTYWIKRVFELENDNFIASEQTIKKIKESYLRISKNLQNDIDKLHTKLNSIDNLALDDIKVYEYRENLLNNLKAKIYEEYKNLAKTEIDISTNHYKGVINNTYKTMADYLRSIKTSASFSMLKTEAIQDLLSIKWLGENYSTRVWKNTNLLANKMTDILLDGLVTGKSISSMSEQINKVMRAGSFNCERLIRTETNFFQNRTSLKAYEDYGIEKYEYLAKIDGRTSPICNKLNGQIFDIDKAKVGINYPPMHPFCRSTTIAYFDDEQLQEDDKDSIIDKNIFPDKIANIKRGKEMTREEANHGKPNPNYYKGGGFKENCQSCVVVYEARLRGYDVQALSNTKGSKLQELSKQTNKAWIDTTTGEFANYIYDNNVTNSKKAYDFINNVVGEGKRYTIQFIWKGRGLDGHIISLDRDINGNLRFYDPQTGDSYDENGIKLYLNKIKYTTTISGIKIPIPPKILRIDDKAFNLDMVNYIMEGAK